jgi:phosphoribosylformylglycinamidine synthase
LYYACASRGPGALGGSVLADLIGLERPPLEPIDYACARSACDFVRAGIAAGAILSAHDVSDGGVFAAVAEMAFATRRGPRLGAALNLHGGGLERDEELGLAFFNEGGGFVFEAGPGFAEFHRIWGSAAVRELGTTTRQFDLRIERGSRPPLRWSVDELYDAWAAPLRSFYESAAG